MEPWHSWTIVAVAGAGAYWYYTRQRNNRRRNGRPAVVPEPLQSFRRKVENKTKRRKDNATGNSDQTTSDAVDVASGNVPSSGGEQIKNRKGGKKKQTSGLAKSSAVEVSNGDVPPAEVGSGGDDVDNREFARQLVSVQAGTSLQNTTKVAKPLKTKKQSQINGSVHVVSDSGVADSKDMSRTSSTTGADADDDLSLPNSPDFGATLRADIGVSDMLETPAPGPSVLRLTESTQPPRPSAPKQSKVAQAEETKKQRQRKAKNEARKAELAQQEKERRVLLEKQLRTVREAEGRPAKNGVPVSASPASNAWVKSANGNAAGNADSTAQVKGVSISNGSLLDTFDQTSKTAPNGNKQNIGLKHDPQESEGDAKLSDQNWPSEEEQMRMLDEIEESSWQTVNAKKRVASKKEDAVTPRDEVGAKNGLMGDAACRKTNTTTGKDSATSQKTNSTSKRTIGTAKINDGVVMGMKIDTSEADDGEATADGAAGHLTTVGSGNARSKSNTHGSLVKEVDGTKKPAIGEPDVKGLLTEPSAGDTTATEPSISESTTTPETTVKQPTSETAVKEEEEKPRKKKKKGEYLPYKDKPHPQDSDWAVV